MAVLMLGALAAGCAHGRPDAHGAADRGAKVTVFAASSLTVAFSDIARSFEARHPGTRVDLNFAGSSDLVTQIQQGAPADVLAAADDVTMAALVRAGLVGSGPEHFASNTLEIVVPKGNPAGVNGLADLAGPGLAVVVCAPVVPCGAAAAKVERAASIEIRPVSEEQSVVDVLNKVSVGEADAGLVYVTDVKAAGSKVAGIAFDEARDAVNRYPIATVRNSDHPAAAEAFLAAVLSPSGQDALARAGFGRP